MKSPAEHELAPSKPLQFSPNLFLLEGYIHVNHGKKIKYIYIYIYIFVFGEGKRFKYESNITTLQIFLQEKNIRGFFQHSRALCNCTN
jgi:hypothetical protein